jgi:imidazolonepropionase
MKTDLIIYNVAQLLTCASNGKPKRGAEMRNVDIIENGALAIKDEVIIAIGKSGEIIKNFESENVIDAHKKVVCPAFVDPHTHIVYAGNRLNEFELKIKGADYLEILENGGGIISTVKQTRQASLKELIEQSRRRLDKMFSNGTLTAEIKTGYGLDTETATKFLRAIRGITRTKWRKDMKKFHVFCAKIFLKVLLTICRPAPKICRLILWQNALSKRWQIKIWWRGTIRFSVLLRLVSRKIC